MGFPVLMVAETTLCASFLDSRQLGASLLDAAHTELAFCPERNLYCSYGIPHSVYTRLPYIKHRQLSLYSCAEFLMRIAVLRRRNAIIWGYCPELKK
jgi:hypothetical protein